jgi:mono/diheme cytochrome c family protein
MKKVILWAFVLLVLAACSKKGIATKTKEKRVNVEALFSNNCARCHGSDGKTGRAPDLSRCELDKSGVIDKITNGGGRMPAFEDKLTKREIEAMSSFVLALKK